MANKGDLNEKVAIVYSVEEVRKHNTETDGWMVVDGIVCEVTPFLEKHPGGKEIMLPYLGKDATKIFHDESSHSHSKSAMRLLKKYQIGITPEHKSKANDHDQEYWDTLVDLTQPIVAQILALPGTLYQPWLDHVTQPMSVTLFSTKVLELVSRWPWWYILVMWIPVSLTMFYRSVIHSDLLTSLFTFCVGVFAWTLAEYFIHRFAFHVETSTAPGNFYHFFAHGAHHLFPMDKTRLSFPPFFSIPLAIGIHMMLDNIYEIESGWEGGYAGLALSYMMYDTLHYYFHHGSPFWESIPLIGDYLRRMKVSHLNHHYKDHSRSFGVTTPLWDIVFRTY